MGVRRCPWDVLFGVATIDKLIEQQMCRQVGQCEECQHPDDEVNTLGHPLLGLGIVEAEDVVHVDRSVGVWQLGSRRRQEEVGDEAEHPGESSPGLQGETIITEAYDEEHEEKGQPAM